MNTENEISNGTVSEDAASNNNEAPNNEAQSQTSEAAPSEAAPKESVSVTDAAYGLLPAGSDLQLVYVTNDPLISARTELVQLPNGKTVEISNTMTTGDAIIAAGIFLLISFQVVKFLLSAAMRGR